MALRLTGTSLIHRTTNLISTASNYTAIFWVRPITDIGAGQYRSVWELKNAGVEFVGCASTILGDPQRYNIAGFNGITFQTAVSILTAGNWYPIVYTKNSNTHSFWCSDISIGFINNNISALTWTDMIMGYDGSSTNGTFDVAMFREWSAVLTPTEISYELNSASAVKTANLKTDTPLLSDLLDDSGNGNDWTSSGSISYVASPVIAANGIQANATVIATLPYDLTITPGASDQAYMPELWYKYTPAQEEWIGAYAYGDVTVYQPYIDLITTSVSNPNIDGIPNAPLQFALESGTTYYFRIRADNPAQFPGTLVLNIKNGPTYDAPIGSLFVNDDVGPYPNVFLSAVDGSVLNYRRGFAAGEAGDVLPGGISLFEDTVDGNLKLYDDQFQLITAIALNDGGRMRANLTHFFYALGGSPVVVSKIDSTGAIVNTYSMTGQTFPSAIAASNDGLTLYHAKTAIGSRPIQRWDLVGAVALSDFAPTYSNYLVTDILVLQDDSLIVGYTNIPGGTFTVIHYSSLGAVLNTYSLGTVNLPSGTVPRLAYALDDPNSFWAWLHVDYEYPTGNTGPGFSRFLNIKVSNGSFIKEFFTAEFETGTYDPTDPAVEVGTPYSRFGNPFSCPFIVARVLVTGSGPQTTESITVVKVTVPSGSTETFSITAGGGATPASFDLQDGDTQVLAVSVGNGYSISEIVPAGYTVTYGVSNNSPIDNITVAADENVIVTITNTLINSATGSGLYKIVPNKRDDTLWEAYSPKRIKLVKIPDPFIKTGLIGE